MTSTMHINRSAGLMWFKSSCFRKVRIFINPALEQVANVCSVDVSPDHCVAEWMEPRPGGSGRA